MTAVALPLPTHPIPTDGDGMGPPGPPQPTKFLRIGHAPRLPRRERVARLLNRLAVYLLAWAAVGVGCFWLALGDGSAGLAFIALGGLSMLLLPLRVPRRVRVQSRARRWVCARLQRFRLTALPGGLGRSAMGG